MVDPEFRSIVPSLRTQAINDTTDRKNVGISMNITPNSASNVPMVSLKSTDPKIRTKANFNQVRIEPKESVGVTYARAIASHGISCSATGDITNTKFLGPSPILIIRSQEGSRNSAYTCHQLNLEYE